MTRPLRVFLCHSSADKPAVRELYQKLRAEPWIQPWLDEEELYPGQDWETEIERAVESSDVVLVCLSNGSINKRGFVQKELRFALDVALEMPEETIFIVPLRLEECTPPRSLRDWQYADFFEGHQERAFQRLLISLKKCADSIGVNFLDLEKVMTKKNEIILPRFYRRSIHLEYKVNADAKVIYDYLLQHYTGISFFEKFDKITLQVDTIQAFQPNGKDVFQWGFVASGYQETVRYGYTAIAGAQMTPDPIIESVSEMFLISISQGQKDISIMSFDTDVKHAHMFTTGLVRDLRTAFSVELLSPNQYIRFPNEDRLEGEQKNSKIQAQKADSESLAKAIKSNDLANKSDEEIGATSLAAFSIMVGLIPIFSALWMLTADIRDYSYIILYFVVGIIAGLFGIYLRARKINTWRFVLSAFGISIVATIILLVLSG